MKIKLTKEEVTEILTDLFFELVNDRNLGQGKISVGIEWEGNEDKPTEVTGSYGNVIMTLGELLDKVSKYKEHKYIFVSVSKETINRVTNEQDE